MNACLTGILSMLGAVYCSYPNLIWLAGVYGLGENILHHLSEVPFSSSPSIDVSVLWGSESMCEVILAFNRCVEICSPKWANILFKGEPTSL
jgi:hypothetical protein